MASDIQTVLQEAFRAQECEDDGDVSSALEAYYKAACQLSYFADLHTQKGTAVAGLCQGLVQQYEQRMAVSMMFHSSSSELGPVDITATILGRAPTALAGSSWC